MKEAYKGIKLQELREMLDNAVNTHNATENYKERLEMRSEHKDIADAYNELSLLTVYAKCMKAEKPLIEFTKTFFYTTVSVKYVPQNQEKDGVVKSTEVGSVVEKTETRLKLYKFIDWAQAANKSVTADKSWKSICASSRDAINKEWKKFMDSTDGTKMSKTAVKKAVQKAFDALVFIESEKGLNAIIAKNDNSANYIIPVAAKLKVNSKDNKPKHTINFLNEKDWEDRLFDMFHMAVEGKTFEVIYGQPVEDAVEKTNEKSKAKDKAKAETETTTEA